MFSSCLLLLFSLETNLAIDVEFVWNSILIVNSIQANLIFPHLQCHTLLEGNDSDYLVALIVHPRAGFVIWTTQDGQSAESPSFPGDKAIVSH